MRRRANLPKPFMFKSAIEDAQERGRWPLVCWVKVAHGKHRLATYSTSIIPSLVMRSFPDVVIPLCLNGRFDFVADLENSCSALAPLVCRVKQGYGRACTQNEQVALAAAIDIIHFAPAIMSNYA